MTYFKKLPELKAYLPEDIKDQSISREYLLNVRYIHIYLKFQVLFYERGDIYNQLYKDYKKIKASRIYNKWNNYYIEIPNGVKAEINKYSPIHK